MPSIETIEVFGAKGRLIINKCDLKMWEERDYKVKGSEPAKDDSVPSESVKDKKQKNKVQ